MRNKCDAYVISLLSLPSTADLRTADSYPFVGGELRLITVDPPAFKEAAVLRQGCGASGETPSISRTQHSTEVGTPLPRTACRAKGGTMHTCGPMSVAYTKGLAG
jgi:hypothetical protein